MINLDKLGVSLSTICLIHCLILPAFIIFFPIISLSFLMSEIIEWIFLFLSIVVALSSLCLGYKKHRSKKSLMILGFGFIFLFLSKYSNFNELNIIHNIFVLVGALCIIVAHLINSKLCNSCKKCKLNES